MAGAPPGLQVLERSEAPVRWWRWWLGAMGVLLASAATFVLVGMVPAIEDMPGIRRLYAAHQVDDLAGALVVACAGLAMLGTVAARRFVRAGALARQQRATLDAIVANIPDAIVVADGHGRFRANAAAVRLFGFPAATGDAAAYHMAMAKLDRRHPESGLRIPSGAGVLEAALAGRAMEMDQVIATPEGLRTVHMAGSPIPFAHGTAGGLILAADVTERLAAQAALQAAKDELQQKNAQHLQMARAIAHDLGNALTPAEMHLSILGMGKGDPARSLPVLVRSVDQMHRLVGDLSDMARLESGAMSVAVRQVALPEAVHSALAAMQPLAATKQVALEPKVPKAMPVQADPERLGQVLSNLLSNALKFTPAGGSIRVEAVAEGAMARVTVTDSGMGLDAAQIARLFRPFSQVHDLTKIKERGTGLGLFICKGLLERQGGQMGVTSQGHGKGSTFWFTLPLSAP